MNTSNDAGADAPLIDPYRAIPGQASLARQLAVSRASLKQKLNANIQIANMMDHIDPRAAGYLRSCQPGRYRCNLSKLCCFCGLTRTTGLRNRKQKKLNAIEHPQHLTLSSPSIDKPTKQQLQVLAERFRAFRESRPLQRVVAGGLANIEIKYSEGGCMPHIHAVIDATPTVPVELIRETWHGLGGGHQVDLQSIEKGTAPRVFGYSAQQPSLPNDVGQLSDFYWATKGMKLTLSWGTLHPLHGRPVRKTKLFSAVIETAASST